MAAVIPTEGIPLAAAVIAGAPVDLWVGLRLDLPLPGADAHLADLDIEPRWGTYERRPIPSWAVLDGEAVAERVEFIVGGTDRIAGYLIADAPSGGRAATYADWDNRGPIDALPLDRIAVSAVLAAVSA